MARGRIEIETLGVGKPRRNALSMRRNDIVSRLKQETSGFRPGFGFEIALIGVRVTGRES
jgi:hypothetical protein